MKQNLVVILMAIMISGCAYIMNGDNQDVSIKSNPEGAKVVVTTTGGVPIFEGTTPASVNLKKKYKYAVTVSLDGYTEKTFQIDQTIDMTILGNIICGGIPGLIVDGVTGAMYKLEPEQLVITLQTASLNGGDEKLYAVLSWLGENGETMNIPLELEPK